MRRAGTERLAGECPEGNAANHRQWPHRSARRSRRLPLRGQGGADGRGRSLCPAARFAARFRAQADRRGGPATGLQRRFRGKSVRPCHAPGRQLVADMLPTDGTYYVHLYDAQHEGGPEYGYRLRISPPRPDFELRVVPSSINIRAGSSEVITVHAVRRDGFNGPITLATEGRPGGLSPQRRRDCQRTAKRAVDTDSAAATGAWPGGASFGGSGHDRR